MNLTQAAIAKLPQVDADIWDTQYPGLVLRTRASGTHSYRVRFGDGTWFTLGREDVLTPAMARDRARDVLTDRAHGKDPMAERRKHRGATLADFVTDTYRPWALENQKCGQETLDRLDACFGEFGAKKLTEITSFAIERWRSARLKAGIEKTTVNRDLQTLKPALNKAVEWKLLPANPLATIKPFKTDTVGSLRYLSAAEEQRLRAALVTRDEQRRAARDHANAWRRERAYRERPAHGTYTDHLTPLVLLALNTGLRRGELFNLTWADVDLAGARLTVQGYGTKSGQTRYVPLNAEAVDVLTTWKPATCEPTARVFPGDEGAALDTIKTAWGKLMATAAIAGFRFHDLRHTFASKLVMAGVDLNTVRELLGHADLKMTLRYAHLAPEHKAAAVAKLVQA